MTTFEIKFTFVCAIFVACVFTFLGIDLGGPMFAAAVIALIYVGEIAVSLSHREEPLSKRVIWGAWIFHLACAIGLLIYLYSAGYLTGEEYWWDVDLGHGNFESHMATPSCWNIFWLLGGIRLTILHAIHLWISERRQ